MKLDFHSFILLNYKFCCYVEFSIKSWCPQTLYNYSELYKVPLINEVASNLTNLTCSEICNLPFTNWLKTQKPCMLGNLSGLCSFSVLHNWELIRLKCPHEIGQWRNLDVWLRAGGDWWVVQFFLYFTIIPEDFLVPFTSFWLKLACSLLPQKCSVLSLEVKEIELCDMC